MFQFIEVFKASPEDQDKLLEMRNHLNVRRFMYNEHIIGVQEHRAWIRSLEEDRSRIAFVVRRNGTVIGFASFSRIDWANKTCDWAFYLDDSLQGKGLGAKIEVAMLEKAFKELQMEKLNCEVLATNPAVVNLHKRFGFVEEGFRRFNVIKDGQRVGVHLLGITKTEWLDSQTGLARQGVLNSVSAEKRHNAHLPKDK